MSFNEQQNNEFSNCLILKVSLGEDTRKFPIANDDITYDELVIMMQRIFSGKLRPADDVIIKYRDDDDDLITIRDTSDLSFAIACSRLLKLTLLVNGKPAPLETDEVKFIKNQLKQMRDLSVSLLDRLDLHAASKNLVNGEVDFEDKHCQFSTLKFNYLHGKLCKNEATLKEEIQKEVAPQPPTGGQSKQPPTVPGQPMGLDRSYEFDPLHQKSQQLHRLETDGLEEKHQLHGLKQKMEIQPPAQLQNSAACLQHFDGSKVDTKQQLTGLELTASKQSRPDTPSSLGNYSERAGSQKPLENVQLQQQSHQQHDVAMIQPSLHQQINATPLAQMSNLNGPTAGAPSLHHQQQQQQVPYGGAAPPPPPTQQPTALSYQPRPTAAHAPQYFGGQPQQMAAVYQSPQQHHSQQPTYAPPSGTQQQHGSYPSYQQQMQQAHQTPPTSVYGVAGSMAGQYSSAPPPPQPSANQQQAMLPPPPTSSSIGPPPMMGGAPAGMSGANPFARHSQSPYVRKATFSGPGQY